MLGTLVVEIEADDGTVGFAVTTGGELGAFIVEKHLARFSKGAPVTDIEKIWDQMYFSTQYYGRKGLVVNAISGVDLALWDLLGKLRGRSPCTSCSAARCATSWSSTPPARGPTSPRRWASSAASCRLQHGPAEGEEGLDEEHRQARGHAQPRRRRLLADVRLLDEPRSELRDPAGPASARHTG